VSYALVLDGKAFRLRGKVVLIGRSSRCRVVLEDASVSRQHAKIELTDVVQLVDLSSANGVFVNGQRIVRPHPLVPGDRVGIGDVDLEFVEANDTLTEDDEEPGDDLDSEDLTVVNDATSMLCRVARRMLDDGLVDEAEATLAERWPKLSSRGHAVHPALAVFAAQTGLRLAAAKDKQKWADEASLMLAAADIPPDDETLSDLEAAAEVVGVTYAMVAFLKTLRTRRSSMDEGLVARVDALLARG
jgi:pSer/pThr/pTyr-binding forkhead associated (FHA) protein